MLPFSSIDFFWLFLLFFGIVLICRAWLRSFIPYRRLLLFITLFYIIGYFTEPLKAFGFVAYCYLVYFLFDYIFKLQNKLGGSILLALPMIFVKAHWQTDFVSFAGLSYITFRVIQIYLDNDRSSKPVSVPDFFLFMLFNLVLNFYKNYLDVGAVSSNTPSNVKIFLGSDLFPSLSIAKTANSLALINSDGKRKYPMCCS